MPLSWRQIVRQVHVAPSLNDALTLIVHGVKDALPVDACAVYLSDTANDQFVLMASEGLDATSAGRLRLGPEGLVGLVAQRRELVVLTNAAAHPRYSGSPEAAEERYGSFIGMKLSRSRSPFLSKLTSISTPGYSFTVSLTPCIASANAFWSNLPTFSVTALTTYIAV